VFDVARLATFVFLLAVLLAPGCREEGAAEKAGRKLDEAVDQLTRPREGPLEKLGRKTDEAVEDVKEALEEE
jgi:hypothetical protein